MKKLSATLFFALLLGGAICAGCTDKKAISQWHENRKQ